MIKKTLTVLLIEDNAEYAELVQRWLSLREDATFILNWTDSLMEGMNSLTLGGVDVILLDLSLPDSDGLNTFTTIKTFAPGVPIIILSASDSESLALRLVQEGAQDYLLKSICNGDSLAKAIQYALVRYTGPTPRDGAPRLADPTKVIGVIGAKGGVGATTVACNLALELRRQTGEKTLLVDLDVHSGLVSFLMNLQSDTSIADAVTQLSAFGHFGLAGDCGPWARRSRYRAVPRTARRKRDQCRQTSPRADSDPPILPANCSRSGTVKPPFRDSARPDQ